MGSFHSMPKKQDGISSLIENPTDVELYATGDVILLKSLKQEITLGLLIVQFITMLNLSSNYQ